MPSAVLTRLPGGMLGVRASLQRLPATSSPASVPASCATAATAAFPAGPLAAGQWQAAGDLGLLSELVDRFQALTQVGGLCGSVTGSGCCLLATCGAGLHCRKARRRSPGQNPSASPMPLCPPPPGPYCCCCRPPETLPRPSLLAACRMWRGASQRSAATAWRRRQRRWSGGGAAWRHPPT